MMLLYSFGARVGDSYRAYTIFAYAKYSTVFEATLVIRYIHLQICGCYWVHLEVVFIRFALFTRLDFGMFTCFD